VGWHTKANRWRAAIKHQSKKVFLGTYTGEGACRLPGAMRAADC
jgi:hypothetical protein